MKVQFMLLLLSAASTVQAQHIHWQRKGRTLDAVNDAIVNCLKDESNVNGCVTDKTGFKDPFSYGDTYASTCARFNGVVPAYVECSACLTEDTGCKFLADEFFSQDNLKDMGVVFNYTGPVCTQTFSCSNDETLDPVNDAIVNCLKDESNVNGCVTDKTGFKDPFSYGDTYASTCARFNGVVPAYVECSACLTEDTGCKFLANEYFSQDKLKDMGVVFDYTGPVCTQTFSCSNDESLGRLLSPAFLTISLTFLYALQV